MMKLTGELKKQVEETRDRLEVKKVIEQAGIRLTDEELDQVDGGAGCPKTKRQPGSHDPYINPSR